MKTLGLGAGLAALLATGLASANTITPYIGTSNAIGPDNGFTFDGDYVAQRDAFRTSMGQWGSDSFENLSGFLADDGTTVTPLSFGTSFDVDGALTIDAPNDGWPSSSTSLAPQVTDTDPELQNGPNGAFSRQATDGDDFLFVGIDGEGSAPGDAAATFTVAFDPDDVVRGFGFSVTDLGDFGATITISFFDGTSEDFLIGSANEDYFSADDFQNGDHIWAGFTADETIAAVTMSLDPGTDRDAFSFDEFTVVVVPVPPAVGIAALGLVAAAGARRRLLGARREATA